MSEDKFYNTHFITCYRANNIPDIEQKLLRHGVRWHTMISIPFINIHGQNIGTQYLFVYQHTEELSIEVQT